jgi:flagellar biosynthesis/type III secretory pathway protein FliH
MDKIAEIKVPSEQNKKKAEEIVNRHIEVQVFPVRSSLLTDDIAQALADKEAEAVKAERERCAKIAKAHEQRHSSGYRCESGYFIAAAIREAKGWKRGK